MSKGPRDHCNKCGKRVESNWDSPIVYCCYCWCGRTWCSEACAKAEGYLFVGDAYDTDHVSCAHCRTPEQERQWKAEISR
jgi:hypothetical protein